MLFSKIPQCSLAYPFLLFCIYCFKTISGACISPVFDFYKHQIVSVQCNQINFSPSASVIFFNNTVSHRFKIFRCFFFVFLSNCTLIYSLFRILFPFVQNRFSLFCIIFPFLQEQIFLFCPHFLFAFYRKCLNILCLLTICRRLPCNRNTFAFINHLRFIEFCI